MRSASVSFSPIGRPSQERLYNPFSTLWILSSRSEAEASQLRNGRDDGTSNNVRIAKNLKNPLLSVLNLTRSKTSPLHLILFRAYTRASVSLKFFRLIRTCARDEIPWKFVFGRIKELPGTLSINPEIHLRNRVQQVIKFCNDLMKSGRSMTVSRSQEAR
jgi:hypothetical protein